MDVPQPSSHLGVLVTQWLLVPCKFSLAGRLVRRHRRRRRKLILHRRYRRLCVFLQSFFSFCFALGLTLPFQFGTPLVRIHGVLVLDAVEHQSRKHREAPLATLKLVPSNSIAPMTCATAHVRHVLCIALSCTPPGFLACPLRQPALHCNLLPYCRIRLPPGSQQSFPDSILTGLRTLLLCTRHPDVGLSPWHGLHVPVSSLSSHRPRPLTINRLHDKSSNSLRRGPASHRITHSNLSGSVMEGLVWSWSSDLRAVLRVVRTNKARARSRGQERVGVASKKSKQRSPAGPALALCQR